MKKQNYYFLFLSVLIGFQFISCQQDNLRNNTSGKKLITEPIVPELTGTIADTLRASSLLSLGGQNRLRERLKIALKQVKEAREIYLKYDIKDKRLAYTIHLLMLTYQSLKDFSNADTQADELVLISDSLGINYYRENLLNLKGEKYLITGQLDSAEFYFLASKETKATLNKNEIASTSRVDMNLSAVYYRKGQHLKSLTLLEKTAKNERLKFGETPSLLNNIEINLGVNYVNLGELELAANHFKNAYRLAEKWDSDTARKDLILNNLGNILGQIGQGEEAIVLLEKVISSHKSRGDTTSFLYGAVNYSMGLAQLSSNQYDNSIQYYKNSISIWEAQEQPIPPAIASCYTYIGKNYFEQNQYEVGKSNYKKALGIYKNAPEFFIENAEIALELAEAAFNNGEIEECRKQTNTFFSLINYDEKSSVKEYPAMVMKGLLSKGQLFYYDFIQTKDKKYLEKAKYNIDKSFELSKNIIREVRDPDSIKYLISVQTHLLEHVLIINKMYSNVFLINQDENFLNIFEASKNLIFEQTLKKNNFFANQLNKDSLFIKEVLLRNDLREKEKTFFQRSKNMKKSEKVLGELELNIAELKLDYRETIKSITKKYPEFAELIYGEKRLNLKKVQIQLSKSKQDLIEYFIGKENIFILLVQANNVTLLQIKKDFSLEDKIQDTRCNITNQISPKSDCHNASNNSYLSNSRSLYETLFAPLQDKLTPNSRLVIVPDGVLSYLPFEILLTEDIDKEAYYGKYPYLIKKYPISYAYSAASILESAQKQLSPSKSMVAFVPDFSVKNTSFKEKKEQVLLSNLSYASAEAAAAQKVFGGDIFTGEKATELAFKEKAKDYNIIILPTHAVADDRNGKYSFLAFQPIPDDVENEFLYNREIYDLRLNAEMVVLSACETGVGEWQNGEGIISLARGFGYAGAKSTVTSLWSVKDLNTQKVLSFFYNNLEKGMTKDEALRQAKLEYLSRYSELGQQPYFWAGMIVIGDAGILESI